MHGHLLREGWGAAVGYPALLLAPDGPPVPVPIPVQGLESADLPAHWARLDDIEGPGYERVLTTVHTADGALEAYIYVHRSAGDS